MIFKNEMESIKEISRAKAIIAELRLTNEKTHQLGHALRNLRTVQRLLREQIHRISSTLPGQSSGGRRFNDVVSPINITKEEEPPKPPPDEDEPNPPIKEPPTEEPPVKEPPPRNR